MLSSNHERSQQQVQQQYKDHTQIDKAIKRILIISPEDDVNLALKTALEQGEGKASGSYNFRVECFNNPVLAIRNFKSDFYDLLIVDVIMPQINGFDLTEEIKKIDQNLRVCFLIAGEVPGKLRANQFRVEGEEGYEDKFIQIPIENNNLVRLVTVVIGS
ncbi:MAG TPA: response regulator [Nitrososphaeraceae archaeon]|nr:response regulator [Nitrososphaeraceae archaeon]